ncbi:sulfite exporter TauE/SafE family protein [Pseudonocardia thermophila]|uniref:sulfite exporter TauE/SafE family protein n=1 Tax=Pseudonocardia thermophila TaxID=1848 RepID=UPI00248DCDF0|nr:sulfite exporter TauE/SafE family protein [Pseudonocardia thermophila]
MEFATVVLLVGAGVAAGLSGSIAGLASLFSYPALLAVGLPATTANVTNTVALTLSSVGSTLGSRPELVGQAPVLRRYALLALVGGASGAGLLLLTPPGTFERIVPVLVGGAAIVLLLQPWIRGRIDPTTRASGPAVAAGILAVTVYGGYFGAAAGVLMLALLLVGLPVTLLQGNAIKNVLLGLANAVAAVGFAVLADVQWWAVAPLAVGLFVGSFAGPAVARRVPTAALRTGIGLAGLGLAVALAIEAW